MEIHYSQFSSHSQKVLEGDQEEQEEGAQTSKRWELTFFPFFIHVIRGLGSPVAWHTKEATPPDSPVWSSGTLTKTGLPRRDRDTKS